MGCSARVYEIKKVGTPFVNAYSNTLFSSNKLCIFPADVPNISFSMVQQSVVAL